MSKFFREVIFPSKPKEAVVLLNNVKRYESNIDYNESVILDVLWCGPKKNWISMAECIECEMGTKTIREILEDSIGCD